VCMHACVRACVCACVRVRVCVRRPLASLRLARMSGGLERASLFDSFVVDTNRSIQVTHTRSPHASACACARCLHARVCACVCVCVQAILVATQTGQIDVVDTTPGVWQLCQALDGALHHRMKCTLSGSAHCMVLHTRERARLRTREHASATSSHARADRDARSLTQHTQPAELTHLRCSRCSLAHADHHTHRTHAATSRHSRRSRPRCSLAHADHHTHRTHALTSLTQITPHAAHHADHHTHRTHAAPSRHSRRCPRCSLAHADHRTHRTHAAPPRCALTHADHAARAHTRRSRAAHAAHPLTHAAPTRSSLTAVSHRTRRRTHPPRPLAFTDPAPSPFSLRPRHSAVLRLGALLDGGQAPGRVPARGRGDCAARRRLARHQDRSGALARVRALLSQPARAQRLPQRAAVESRADRVRVRDAWPRAPVPHRPCAAASAIITRRTRSCATRTASRCS
jgi:hypothetical protein